MYDIQHRGVAAGGFGYSMRLLKDVVHQDATETVALGAAVDCDLAGEQDWDLAMVRQTARSPDQIVRVHTAGIDCVIAQDAGATILDQDVHPGHVILLLLGGGKLQVVVQTREHRSRIRHDRGDADRNARS